jgi:hypothetical protein
MSKKITIGTKPKKSEDEIIQNFIDGTSQNQGNEHVRSEDLVSFSRLTVIIPKSLHKKLKLKAFEQEKNIADLVTEILQKNL